MHANRWEEKKKKKKLRFKVSLTISLYVKCKR